MWAAQTKRQDVWVLVKKNGRSRAFGKIVWRHEVSSVILVLLYSGSQGPSLGCKGKDQEAEWKGEGWREGQWGCSLGGHRKASSVTGGGPGASAQAHHISDCEAPAKIGDIIRITGDLLMFLMASWILDPSMSSLKALLLQHLGHHLLILQQARFLTPWHWMKTRMR